MKEVNYLFVTHGRFGKGIVNSLEVIMGSMLADYEVDYIEIGIETSNNEVIDSVYDYLEVNKDKLIFILTDIPIGSSTQNCVKAIEKIENKLDNVHLISGVNLSFVLSIFMLEITINQSIAEQIKELVEQNKEMLVYVNSEEGNEIFD